MSNKRINKLAENLEAAQGNPELLEALIKKAKVCDLLVLHFLKMGYSGPGESPIVAVIGEALETHFSDGGEYLVHGSTGLCA
jgi:ABC-type uncharacterized transport system YnjBCD ATPase subunit